MNNHYKMNYIITIKQFDNVKILKNLENRSAQKENVHSIKAAKISIKKSKTNRKILNISQRLRPDRHLPTHSEGLIFGG